MISDLFVNITILTSFTFMWHQLFRNNRLQFNSSLKIKLLDGFIGGMLGILLMHYSIQVNAITILDLRHIPIVLLAFYGGVIPPLIAAAVISVGRFLIDVNFSSVVSLFMMFAMAIGSGLIAKYVQVEGLKKWMLLLGYTQFIFTLALYIVVDKFSHVLHIAINHIISSIIGGFLTYYFVSYIRRYTQLYLWYKESSQRDSLTGLYNVRSFDYFYNGMLDKAKQESSTFAICLIDVDHFKKVNDTYGHPAGDQVLKQLANLLSKLMRQEDVVSRNGGEEFSILLDNCSIAQALEVAERIRVAIENTKFILPDKKKIHLTVSIGVAAYNESILNEDLYEAADNALYDAKKQGRNRVFAFLMNQYNLEK